MEEIKGERAFEVYAAMVGPMSRIAKDKDVVAAFHVEKPEGIDPRDFMVDALAKAIPAVITKHRDDIVAIMAAVDGKDASEYSFETFDEVKALHLRVKEIITDRVFLSFLR